MQVAFQEVTKNFGVVTALKDITFHVDEGDFIFIVGPSGCGKSTLLKLIMGQLRPSSGQINIDGSDLSKTSKNTLDNIRRQIGVIFQDYQLLFDKTIEENIALALDIVNTPRQSILPIIEDVLQKVRLESRRHLFPSQLSGGELQRAALARALSVKPRIILADEPTGNLDPENSWNLVKLLKDINEINKTTIIMTTHNLDIIQSLSKRIIKLDHGSIVNDTKPVPETVITPKVKKKIKKIKIKTKNQ